MAEAHGEGQTGRSREDYLKQGVELLADHGQRALTAVRVAAGLVDLIGVAWRGSAGMQDVERRAKIISLTTRGRA